MGLFEFIRRFGRIDVSEPAETAPASVPIEIASAPAAASQVLAIDGKPLLGQETEPASAKCSVYVVTAYSDDVDDGALRVGVRLMGSDLEIRTSNPDLVKRFLEMVSRLAVFIKQFTDGEPFTADRWGSHCGVAASKLKVIPHALNVMGGTHKLKDVRLAEAIQILRTVQNAVFESALAKTDPFQGLTAALLRASDDALMVYLGALRAFTESTGPNVWAEELGQIAERYAEEIAARIGSELEEASLQTCDGNWRGFSVEKVGPNKRFQIPAASWPVARAADERELEMGGSATSLPPAQVNRAAGPEPVLVVTLFVPRPREEEANLTNDLEMVPFKLDRLLEDARSLIPAIYNEIAHAPIAELSSCQTTQEQGTTDVVSLGEDTSWPHPQSEIGKDGDGPQNKTGFDHNKAVSHPNVVLKQSVAPVSSFSGGIVGLPPQPRASKESALTRLHQQEGNATPVTADLASELVPVLMQYGGRLPFENMIDLLNRRFQFHSFSTEMEPKAPVRAAVVPGTLGAIQFYVESIPLGTVRDEYERLDFAARIRFLAQMVRYANKALSMEIRLTATHLLQHQQTVIQTIRDLM